MRSSLFLRVVSSSFAQESKSALVNIVVLVGCVAGAALFCAIGFLFPARRRNRGVGACVACLVDMDRGRRRPAALRSRASLRNHVARSRMKKPMFRATAAELKKDSEWLKNLEKTDL